MNIEQEVLNAASDDWESLEQIYRSICLEFSSERYVPNDPSSFYWRENSHGISLAQIAEATIQLVATGMLEARQENGEFVPTVSGCELWQYWFKTSELVVKLH